MVDTELIVRVAQSGAGKAAKDILEFQKALEATGKNAKDAKVFAEALGKALNLPAGDVDDLAKALASVSKEAGDAVDKVGLLNDVLKGVAQGVGQQLTQAATSGLQSAIGAVTGVVSKANAEFGGFDKALTEFAAKSGIARSELGPLGDQVKELAAVTSQSPTGVASLATALLGLGASADQVATSLGAITKLADVVGEDPVVTGQVVQTGLNIFAQFGETADSVSDKLANLLNLTAAGSEQGISEFSQLFQDAGAAAAGAGVSFDELGTAFAALRAGGTSAAVAGTGIKTVLLGLASPTTEAATALKKVGINAFDGAGKFVGLTNVLKQYQAASKNLNQQEQLNLAKTIFGAEGAPAILTLIQQLDTSYAAAAKTIQDSNGAVAKTLDVINQSVERQAELLSGEVDSALVAVGEALAPVKSALLGFTTEIVSGFSKAAEASDAFDPIVAAGERLQKVFKENPELARSLGEALADVAASLVKVVSGGLNQLSDFLQNNPEAVTSFAQSMSDAASRALELAGSLGPLVGGLAQIATGAGVGAADAFAQLSPVIAAAAGFLSDVVEILAPLTSNTALVSAAIQALVVQMLALKGIALATAIAQTATAIAGLIPAAAGATLSIRVLAATTAPAAASFVALAAAIALVNFVKLTADMSNFNKDLDGFSAGIDAAGDTGLSFANKLNTINDEVAKNGFIEGQAEKLKQFKALAEAQIGDLQQLLTQVQTLEPKNEAQANAKAAAEAQIKTTISALDKQIKEAGTNLEKNGKEQGKKTGKALGTGIAEGTKESQPEIRESLESLSEINGKALQKLETQGLEAKAKILEAGGTQSELAALDEQGLQKRIATNQQYLAKLKDLQANGVLTKEDAKKVGNEVLAVEQKLASDRVAVAQSAVAATKAALDDLAKVNNDAIQKIDADSQLLIASRTEQGASAEEIAGIEKKALADRLVANEKYVSDLKALQAKGGLGPEEAKKVAQEILRVEAATAKERVDAAKKLEAEALKASEDTIKKSQSLRERSILELEQKLRQSGATEVAIAEQVAEAKFKAEQAAIQEQIKLTQQRAQATGVTVAERRAAEIEISNLQNDLIKNQIDREKELQAQVKARIDEALKLEQQKSEIVTAGLQAVEDSLARQSELIKTQLSLTQAISGARDAVAGRQESRLKSALSLQEQLTDLNKDTSDQRKALQDQLNSGEIKTAEERRAVEEELAELQKESGKERKALEDQLKNTGVDGATSKRAVEQQMLSLQKQRNAEALAGLLQQQKLEQLNLEIEIKRNAASAQRATIEAQLAALETQAALRQAQADGDQQAVGFLQQKLALQQQALTVAQQQQQTETQNADQQRKLQALQQSGQRGDLLAQQQGEARGLADELEASDSSLASTADQYADSLLQQSEAADLVTLAFAGQLEQSISLLDAAQQRLAVEEQITETINRRNPQGVAGSPIDGARRMGGPVQGGKTYLVGEDGPELVTPSRNGYVHTAGQTAAMLQLPSMRGVPTAGQMSTQGIEARLDKLLAAVQGGRQVIAPSNVTINTQQAEVDFVSIELERLQRLTRGM